MPETHRPIKISYSKAATGEVALPNIGGATHIKANAHEEPPGPYRTFGADFSYRPGEDHLWEDSKVKVTSRVYFDESGVLWAKHMEITIGGARFAEVTLREGGQPLTVALDHLPSLISLLGVEASGSRADDRLTGDKASDVLKGNGGDDTLSGGDGADRLVGGAGRDHLWGGKGADVFVMNGWDLAGKASRDVIEDFRNGDRIDLRAIDADRADRETNDRFTFIGSDPFSGEAGELRYVRGVVRGDIDGDGRGDFTVEIANEARLDAADFFL